MSSSRSGQLGQVWSARLSQVSLVGFDYMLLPTSEDYNYFVRAPFRVLLESMERKLSQDSRYVPVEGSR